jgi:hypothetical protein
MTAAAIPLMIAATMVSAYSAYQQGQTAAQQSRAQAAWHTYNAKIAKREAEAERRATAFEVKQQARRGKTLQARLRTLVGASGVEMAGSPLLVAEDTAAQLALESANIRTTGARRVQRWRSQSILDVFKARTARRAASEYEQAGILQAGAGLLGGAAQVSYMGSQTGVGGGVTSEAGTGTMAWSGYGRTRPHRTSFRGL